MRHKKITNWDDLGILIDVETLALIMDCAPSTITRWTREGKLKSVQITRKHMYNKSYIRKLVEGEDNE